MLGEVTHLQAISDDLKALTSDPHKLPPASEQVKKNIKDDTVLEQFCLLKKRCSVPSLTSTVVKYD